MTDELRIRRRDLAYGRKIAREFELTRLRAWWPEMSKWTKRRVKRADPYLYSILEGLVR